MNLNPKQWQSPIRPLLASCHVWDTAIVQLNTRYHVNAWFWLSIIRFHGKSTLRTFVTLTKKVTVLKRIKFLPKPVLQTIYFKTIFPSVLYGIVVWGSCSQSLLDDIDRTRLRATKIIYSLPREIHSAEVRNLPLWNPIVQFYFKRLVTICLNIYHDTCIVPLTGLIVKSRVNYNFRQSANIEVPRPRTEIGQSSFMHRAALCWNLLPNSCKHSSSLGYFKKFLKGK